MFFFLHVEFLKLLQIHFCILHLETPYQGLSCFAVLEELINLSLVNKTKTKRFFIFQNHGEFDVFWGFIIHFNEP